MTNGCFFHTLSLTRLAMTGRLQPPLSSRGGTPNQSRTRYRFQCRAPGCPRTSGRDRRRSGSAWRSVCATAARRSPANSNCCVRPITLGTLTNHYAWLSPDSSSAAAKSSAGRKSEFRFATAVIFGQQVNRTSPESVVRPLSSLTRFDQRGDLLSFGHGGEAAPIAHCAQAAPRKQ